MLRRARHPLTSTLLALALTLLLADTGRPPRRILRPATMPQLWVVAHDGVLTVLDPGRDSMDRITRTLFQTPAEIAAFQPEWPVVNDWRLWRTPRRPTTPRLVVAVDPGWNADQLASARSAVIEHLVATGRVGDEVAEALRTDPGGRWGWHGTSILWNLGIWTLVVLVAWSLGWVPVLLGRWRDRRLRARLMSGLCPGCRYPMPPGAVRCPECGEKLPGSCDRVSVALDSRDE